MNDTEYENLLKSQKEHIKWLRKLAKHDYEQAKKYARESLIMSGILDYKGDLAYPYNGEVRTGDEFTRGPVKKLGGKNGKRK